MTTIESPETKRETFLATIGVTAVEGGINYWSSVSGYRWYFPDLDGGSAAPAPHGGGNVVFTVHGEGECEDDFEPTLITLADIERGWKLFLDNLHKDHPNTTRLRECDAASDDIHTMIDANYADQVIQYAVLGSHDYA